MSDSERNIFVYTDTCNSPVQMGVLYISSARGKETFSFEYNCDWLAGASDFVMLDPDLSLYSGRQYAPLDKSLFGLFSDSCPDRWGRLLMNRREAINAKRDKRKPRALTESDYLLGVYDETRMGALRYSLTEGGPFLSYDKALAAPPWTTLRSLESASIAFENGDADEEHWLRQLLAPGSSLGGARPKASVLAPNGSLWIAKFPSKLDEWNTGAWEMVTHELAKMCGLSIPGAKLESFSEYGSTYLTKRFDRKDGKRIHFLSAMTLLGKTDGSGSDGTGYLDIASFIRSNGAYPKQDLIELWKRVVFGMNVSNTDDHLRNHGFLLTENGWRLSPMFDVNPNIYGNTLSLNVNQSDNSIDLALAIETAELYDIDTDEAKSIARDIQKTVRDNWRSIASGCGLSHSAVSHMEPAFETMK